MSQSELHRIHLPGCEYINRTPPTMNISYSGKHELASREALLLSHMRHILTCHSYSPLRKSTLNVSWGSRTTRSGPGSFILIVVYLHCTVA